MDGSLDGLGAAAGTRWLHPYTALQSGRYSSLARVAIPIEMEASADPAARMSFLLACFAAYCARLAEAETLEVGYLSGMDAVTPLRIAVAEDDGFEAFRLRLGDELGRHRAAGVTGRIASPARVTWPVVLAELGHRPTSLTVDGLMVLAVYADGSPPDLWHRGLTGWQAEAIAMQVAALVQAATRQPGALVRGLPLLAEDERRRLLVDWNQTDTPFPSDRCVHELVSLQAARTPDAPAVRFAGRSISYATLEARSTRVARWLVARGVSRGELVGVCLRRGLDQIVALLGVLKAGCAYVPLDPTYPPDRVAYMVADSGMQLAITECGLDQQVLGSLDRKQVFCLDGASWADDQVTPLPDRSSPDDLAYVIYTSGSSGRPKAVEIRHRSLVNHSWAMGQAYQLGPGQRMLCSASISFDVAGEQIYPALFRGAEIVIRPDDLLDSFDRFGGFLTSERITALALPTAFWHEWVRVLDNAGKQAPDCLLVLGVGTEKALPEHLATWLRLTEGRTRFLQGYGPTEATITCTLYVHDGSPPDAQTPLPIGRPLPNTTVYLLDGAGQPVPVGMPGEMYIGGVGVARGYLRREDLSRERFLPNPFRPGERMYRTGDVARWLPDGQLVFMGRRDLQVKLLGHRIELGEIESVLASHPAVDQVAVILRQDSTGPTQPGTPRLVGYVVARTADLDLSSLRALCERRLPAYMVPAVLVPLGSLPLTVNGKVDRQALPAPIEAAPEHLAAAPRDDLEVLLADIWSEHLGVTGIGIDQDFFDAGGHSLLAVRVLDDINTRCRARLSLRDLFTAPTVAELAERVRSSGAARVDMPALIPLVPGAAGPPLFFIAGIHLYQQLARAIGPDRRSFGVFLPAEDNMFRESSVNAGLPRVEELARHYLGAIQAEFPDGPYALAGVSFGGVLAFEMARQLTAQGQAVSFLGLLDTVLSRAVERPARRWAQAQWAYLRDRGIAGLAEKGGRLKHHLVRRLGREAKAPPPSTDLPREEAIRRLDAFRGQLYADSERQYDETDHLYAGQAVLFRAIDEKRALVRDPTLGWSSLVPGLEVHQVSGDHLGILRPPHVEALAAAMRRYLVPRTVHQAA